MADDDARFSDTSPSPPPSKFTVDSPDDDIAIIEDDATASSSVAGPSGAQRNVSQDEESDVREASPTPKRASSRFVNVN